MLNLRFFLPVILCILVFRKVTCQEQEDSFTIPDQRNVTRVESVRTSTRRIFKVRPFLGTTKSSLTTSEEEENELSKGPIPRNVWIPSGLDFSCKGRPSGYYTDPSPLSKCQVYHMCMPDGRKYSMLCGVGTIFNQITFVCDHWYNYRCADAESDYNRNNKIWDQFLSPISSEEYDDQETQTNPTSS